MKNVILTFLLLLVPMIGQTSSELGEVKNIAEELIKVRQEIETLHNQLSYEKDIYKEKMRAYAGQKSDLEVRLGRADLNIKELQRDLDKYRDESEKSNLSYDKLLPVIQAAIVPLRQTIASSTPFKRVERLQALDEIAHRMESRLISPNKAANQLWAFIEDELMFGRSSGLYNDVLQIDGEEKLVKVLRLGKVAMFYRDHDENYGVVRRQGGEWQVAAITSSDEITELEMLFDAFNKNINSGQFTTPNFLPKN